LTYICIYFLFDILDSVRTPTVAFRAKDVINIAPTTGQNFIFKTYLFNFGDGYDNQTGIFTAPKNGTYLFAIHLCTTESHFICYEITMNGTPLKRGWFGKSSNCFTTTAISVFESVYGVWMKLISSPTILAVFGTTRLVEHLSIINYISSTEN
jgi:hypothetical protein